MNKKNLILLAVLGVQIALVGVLMLQNSHFAKNDKKGFRLADNADASLSKEINIVNGDDAKTSLLLLKENGRWLLPQAIKANNAKIVETLNKITNIKPSWAVATSKDSHQRFEVAADKFQRKVTLTIGDKKHTFFMGTSPGYRQVHVRLEGSDDVYAVQLNTFEFSAQKDDWLDKEQLQIKEKIVAIKSTAYDFKLNGEQWELVKVGNEPSDTDNTASETTQTVEVTADRAKEIANELKILKLISISDIKNIEQATEQLVITTDKQQKMTYLLYVNDDGLKHLQKQGDTVVYGITQDTYNRLLPKPEK